ncbi:hypothetical protein pEaSNUABM9_00262 [Erwinia phage pEa_SNUABM_9]|nr:hypothetical protein pEaSNUABM9_00262 [Erwinia phage pEa_SNUABM_9]
MKPIYYHGSYKTPVTIHSANHCKHLHVGGWASRTVTQIVDKKCETHFLCRACNDALLEELYGSPVACVDCGKMMAQRDAIPWSCYGHNPADPQIHLCGDCVNEPKHFTRIEQDRAVFATYFSAK